MSDCVVILRNGQVEQAGTPVELYTRPRTRFVASFLGESNFFTGTCLASGGDRFTLSVGEHVLHSDGDCAGVREGGQATIAVRPERIALGVARPEGPNVIAGRVTDLKYLGSSVHAHVDVPGLGTITAKVPATTVEMGALDGAAVFLAWPPEAAVVVSE